MSGEDDQELDLDMDGDIDDNDELEENDEELSDQSDEDAPQPEDEEGEAGDAEVGKPEDEESDEDTYNDDLTDFQKMLNTTTTASASSKQKSRNFLTKYEICSLIGFRAQQIAEGAPVYVEVLPSELNDPSSIARKELMLGKLPLTLIRPLPSRKLGQFTEEIRPLGELSIVYPMM